MVAIVGMSNNSLTIIEVEKRLRRDNMQGVAVSMLDLERFVINKVDEGQNIAISP